MIPDALLKPWPWYVTGPLIGLFAPLLLVVGNRLFGVSSNLRHMCAPFASGIAYFRYDWRGLRWLEPGIRARHPDRRRRGRRRAPES